MSELMVEADSDIAPCLHQSQIAEPARELVSASRQLGASPFASILRAWCVPYLFESTEQIFRSNEEPVGGVNRSLKELSSFLLAAAHSGFGKLPHAQNQPHTAEFHVDIKEKTGEHYGQLFRAFSPNSYWDEPVRLLKTRLERNDVEVANLSDKEVLDAGCGGGRYTVAWRLMGAKKAVGVDHSEIGISDAIRRAGEAAIDNVTFQQGDVLNLPFADSSFDIVFSNGVLHHTTDWQRGVRELLRVLKPEGLGWLYLIEQPGGLFWDVIEILRVVMKDERRDTARESLRMLGLPANRIFYMLDHVMVPINDRLTPEQIEAQLQSAGATEIRRLQRGADIDRIEHIFGKDPYANLKYGVGENRYVFTKK
jgi:ubiquinone/menaquinone biosynthesis C-methylase UbiE